LGEHAPAAARPEVPLAKAHEQPEVL